jgi:hypothetical protein
VSGKCAEDRPRRVRKVSRADLGSNQPFEAVGDRIGSASSRRAGRPVARFEGEERRFATSRPSGHASIAAQQAAERATWLPVADFAAASRACREFIESNDLGSDWCGGAVVDAATKKKIATVSYNGRVWLADGTEAQLHGTVDSCAKGCRGSCDDFARQ